ncbi:MAG: hypothetical protein QUS35_12870 [bacterium]|nr:hypothetical protein [bacterium]
MRRVMRLCLVITCLSGSGLVSAGPSDPGDALLDRLENGCRKLGEPPPKSMTAVQTLKELDGDGRPKSVTTVLKSVAFRDSARVDSVLNAVEEKDGKSIDVTQEWIKKTAKERTEQEKSRKEKQKNTGRKEGSYSMDSEDLFVFRKEIRGYYRFFWVKDTVIGGRSYRRFRASPKVPSEGRFFAEYVMSGDSATVLSARLKPGKFPKMVKHMDMSLRFTIDSEGRYFMDYFAMRFNASLIVKKIRMEITESYKDVRY